MPPHPSSCPASALPHLPPSHETLMLAHVTSERVKPKTMAALGRMSIVVCWCTGATGFRPAPREEALAAVDLGPALSIRACRCPIWLAKWWMTGTRTRSRSSGSWRTGYGRSGNTYRHGLTTGRTCSRSSMIHELLTCLIG
uniref:Uncharacterized protein n=1 Tax=Arundo donax TaxID=35708 RepID=A0A0A8XQB0_ARUDO